MEIIEKIKDFFFVDEENIEMNHVLEKEILREYDVRGVFNKNLFPEDAYCLGRAFGTTLIRKGLKKTCAGCDCRKSSDVLVKNITKGLMDSGVDVVSLGVCHTPMVYYAVHKHSLDAGVMVTGSHNPAEYNGFKFTLGFDPFYGDDIKLLGQMVVDKDFADGNGREIVLNRIFSNYLSDILSGFEFSSEIKAVWDVGNGATSDTVKAVVASIPGRHHVLFEEMDGNFPNRAPDPTVAANVEYLSKFVSYNNFDIGFAFDSDGDRVSVVNNKGEMLFSDQVLEVFATDFLKKNPGAQVIADVKSCNRLFDTIKRLGGVGIMERVGHSFMKARMKSSGALLAGETSGHFFFKDRWLGFDDGIYAALRCLEILSGDKEAFNHLEYGHITPEIRITCEESRKFEIIEKLKNKLKQKQISFIDIDGVRISSEKGWWILRASNTQNALSLRIESYTTNGMKKLKNEVASYLSEYVDNIKSVLEEEHE